MSRMTGDAQSRATCFRHSTVLSLPAVLLRKVSNDGKMSRETVHSHCYATFFRHSAVLSLSAVQLRKVSIDLCKNLLHERGMRIGRWIEDGGVMSWVKP